MITISSFNALHVKKWIASMFLMKRRKQEISGQSKSDGDLINSARGRNGPFVHHARP